MFKALSSHLLLKRKKFAGTIPVDDFDRAKSLFIYRNCGPFLAKISRAIVKAYDDVAGGKTAAKTRTHHAASRSCSHCNRQGIGIYRDYKYLYGYTYLQLDNI